MASPTRADGRQADELRPITLTPNFVIHPEGSVLIAMGQTKVLCNVSIEEGVPYWMKRDNKPGGWLTAEYSLLPRSTHTRSNRETRGPRGRTQEIQRLIGRSLRAAINLEKLDNITCTVDCDVLQADGGTRTAAITGGYVATVIALKKLIAQGRLAEDVFLPAVAAVSVGIVQGQAVLDLPYPEDSTAEADINIVMNDQGEFIEVQGTAEGAPFSRAMLNDLFDLAEKGITELFAVQQKALAEYKF